MQHLDPELVRDFLKGRFSPSAQTAWQQHIDACGDCQALVAQERAFSNMLALDAPLICSTGALDRLLIRVQAIQPRPRFLPRAKTLATATAVLATVTAAAVLTISMRAAARDARQTQQQLGISQQIQSEIITNLTPLAVLMEKPWVAEEYDALRNLLAANGPLNTAAASAKSETDANQIWQALTLPQRSQYVQCYQEWSRRDTLNLALGRARAFAALTPQARQRFCELHQALTDLEKKQTADQRRLLHSLSSDARIFQLQRLLEAARSASPTPQESPIRNEGL